MSTRPSLSGVLESPDDFDSSEEVYEAVGGVLLESIVESDEVGVKGLCETLYSLLIGEEEGVAAESAEHNSGSARLLDAPVQLSSRLQDKGETM